MSAARRRRQAIARRLNVHRLGLCGGDCRCCHDEVSA